MLESDYQKTLNTLLTHVPCSVKIPEAWNDSHFADGTSLVKPDDRRRFARACCRVEALCELVPSLPAIERDHGFLKVYTKDISRSGLAILIALQLFPREEIVVWTHLGRLRCEVTRCLKHNDKCFEIGAICQNLERAKEMPWCRFQLVSSALLAAKARA